MTISELITLLDDEGYECGHDMQVMIYNSSGEVIEPKSFSYGGKSTGKGFVDTISFSELE